MLVTLLLFYAYIINNIQEESSEFSKYFKDTGAKFLSSEIYCGIKLDNRYLNKESIENIVLLYLKNIGADLSQVSKTEYGVEDGLSIKYKVSIHANAIAEIKADINDEQDLGYLNIKINQYTNDEKQNQYVKRLRNVSDNEGLDYKISTIITGYFDGLLKSAQIDSIYKKLLNDANARDINAMKDKGLVSVTAYSPDIENYIRIGNKKVNLNFAARYNSYEKRTYIWIANPVILTEY